MLKATGIKKWLIMTERRHVENDVVSEEAVRFLRSS